MERKNRDNSLINEIEPVVLGLGFSLVEFSSHRNRSNLTVNAIIYNQNGVGLDECTKVYKTILPRIELLEDTRNINLEVSSPGISRNIKYIEEFEIFIGKSVKILKKDVSDWIHGRIISVDNNSVKINVDKNAMSVSFEDINKAKLE